MLGWVIACWAAIFGVAAIVAGALGHLSFADLAGAVAHALWVAAAVLVTVSFALHNSRTKGRLLP